MKTAFKELPAEIAPDTSAEKHIGETMQSLCRKLAVKGQQSRMNPASWGIDVSDTTQCSQARPQLAAIVISCLTPVEL